jgi:bacterioferritin
MAATKDQVIALLTTAYNMELETVTNYLAASVNLDGVRAEEIKKSLAADVTGELGHAQQLGNRIKQLGGLVPGSQNLKFTQTSLQPTSNTTDVVGVIKAVIEAEEAAINQYKKIIRETEGDDYVTQDLAIQLLADEEAHVVLFRGFLKEYAQG